MKIIEPKNLQEIDNIISRLNFCHDASMKKICFLKNRNIDEKTGDLVYPFEDVKDRIKCDIEIELILNSYAGAKKNQIVLFEFKEVTNLYFMQKENFDYSDIYELKFKGTKNAKLGFNFYATEKKIKTLSIICNKVICKEL